MSSILNALGLSQSETPSTRDTNRANIPGNKVTAEDKKRKSANTSNISDSEFDNPKRLNFETSSPLANTEDIIPLTPEQSMVKAMEKSIAGVFTKLDNIINKIDSLENNVSELRNQGEVTQRQMGELLARVREGEERVEQLEQRVVALESRDETGWSPSPVVEVNVKLLGDSNYSGKLKFGTERGTLGSALPGASSFCPKIENLPQSEDLVDFTDIVLAVGTNDLKCNRADPTASARALYSVIKKYRADLPNSRIILPGVLPTSDSVINERVKVYNKHLVDICNTRSNNMVKYLDTRVFCDNTGKLRGKFRVENDGDINLHINQEGTKLLASRLKAALREGHHLPTGPWLRNTPANRRGEGTDRPATNRGGGRGGGRGGSRGRGNGPRGNSSAFLS